MKHMKSGRAQKGGGIIGKYARLAIGAFLLKKLKSMKFEKEIEPEIEPEVEPVEEVKLDETARGSSLMVIGKIVMGALAGATIIYAIKRYTGKKSGYKIDVQ
jgi:hypothetical protein